MSKKNRNLALAGLAVIVVGLVAAVGKVWVRPEGPLPSGIHLLQNLGPAVAYIVETSDGLVLIDSGLDGSGAWLAREMDGKGLDATRVRTILLTHAHGDHSLGADRLRRATGAKVYAGRDDCQVLRKGAPKEAFFS